jgi:hypothetical protein
LMKIITENKVERSLKDYSNKSFYFKLNPNRASR